MSRMFIIIVLTLSFNAKSVSRTRLPDKINIVKRLGFGWVKGLFKKHFSVLADHSEFFHQILQIHFI